MPKINKTSTIFNEDWCPWSTLNFVDKIYWIYQIFLQIFRMAPVGTAGEKNATFLSCSPTWDCRSEKCHIFPLQSQLGLQEKNMPFLASAVPPGTIFKTHPKRYCSPNWGCSNADLMKMERGNYWHELRITWNSLIQPLATLLHTPRPCASP